MNERDETRLRDMLDAARAAQSFLAGKTRQTLDTDQMFAFALIRAIEIIGEAANKISAETRASLTAIPWHRIVGMRNRIIHDYTNVDYDIVWQVATVQIPELITELEKLLDTEQGSDE